MSVSIVIVTYESSGALDRCLSAANRLDPAEVVIVDNGSRDNTVAVAKAYGAHIIEQHENTGFGSAANVGAARSAGDILCLLNPDCILTEEAMTQASSLLGQHPDICAVPSFVYENGIRQEGRQPGYTWRKLLSDIMETNGLSGRFNESIKIHRCYHNRSWYWPLGTCLFIGRKCFEETGGFNPAYFMYMEDVEFGLSLKHTGGQVVSLPVCIEHAAQKGSNVSREHRNRLLNEGRLIYARRHYGYPFYLLLNVVISMGSRFQNQRR